jgi:tRNA-(ms[2]io[6]A)-hydroxylase
MDPTPARPVKVAAPGLPLLQPTRAEWAGIAAASLPLFLADHAVCEQQAALSALHLVGQYPEDDALVETMTNLASEEVLHLRRVSRLLRARGLGPMRRRRNPYVQALRARIEPTREPERKVDRLLVGALIEARSCERFTLLGDHLRERDPEVASLLDDLGPAERRHWEGFWRLASRELAPEPFEARWTSWLRHEAGVASEGGRGPTVHG